MSTAVIAEFLTALGYKVDGASERAAVESARRVEQAVTGADDRSTQASVAGAARRRLLADRERGIRSRGAAYHINELKQRIAAERKADDNSVGGLARRGLAEAKTTAERLKWQARIDAADKAEHRDRLKREKGFYGQRSAIVSTFSQGVLTTLASLGVATTVGGVTAGLVHLADGFERLFYASQRTGASGGGLRSFAYAASQLGSSQQEALGSLEAVASRIRRAPGFETMLKGLGVETHDAAGNVLSFEKRILSLGQALAKRPEYQRYAYADALGIDENTLRAMTSGEMERAYNEYQEMMAKAVLDPEKADKDSKAFMDVYRKLAGTISIIATKIQGSIIGAFGAQLGKLSSSLLENSDKIAGAFIRIGETVLRLIDRVTDIAKAFSNLNPEAKEFVLQIAALGAALLVFRAGPLAIIGAIAAAIVALYDDYRKWKDGSKDTLIDWDKWAPAIRETLEACRSLASGFDSVARSLTGQSGLVVALEALAAVMVLRLLAPLGKVVGLLATLGAFSPPAWLLAMLGISAAGIAAGAYRGAKEGFPTDIAPSAGPGAGAGANSESGPERSAGTGAFAGVKEAWRSRPTWLGGTGGGSGAAGRGGPDGKTVGSWWSPERQQHAIDKLVKGGVSELGAKALVARWAAVEAPQGPSSVNPKSGAFGIGQWLGSRKPGINGNTDFDAQLDYALKELQGPERAALDTLNKAKTPQEAATGASRYERAEGYDPKTGRDNFTDATAEAMGRLGKPSGGPSDDARGGAADSAEAMEGMHERANRTELNAWLKQNGQQIDAARTAWCAAFVNSALASVGVKGSGSNIANSFLKWGKGVEASETKRGDVVVESRGGAPGSVGGHVGIATGNVKRDKAGNVTHVEVISGNHSDRVARGWEGVDSVNVRRAPEPPAPAAPAAPAAPPAPAAPAAPAAPPAPAAPAAPPAPAAPASPAPAASATPTAPASPAPTPGESPAWRRDAEEAGKGLNQKPNIPPPQSNEQDKGPEITPWNAATLGGSSVMSADNRSYKGGDTHVTVSGVSDPKEAAMLTERTLRNRDADTLRNMRSAFA